MRLGGQMTVVCAVLVLTMSPGRAATPQTEGERSSRQHFQKGEAHYSAGRFADALTEYQAGYEAHPLPGFLVNMAQCYRRLGNLKRARASYEKFIWVAPDSPLVAQVHPLIAEIDRLLSEGVDAEPGADGGPDPGVAGSRGAGTGRAGAPVSLAAPAPALPAANPPGAALVPAASQTPSTSPQSSTPGSTATHRRWWLWGTIGAAVLGGTAAAIALSATPDPTTIHQGTLGTLRR